MPGKRLLAIALLLASAGTVAQEDSGVTANLTLTSDYVFRGISQSDGTAALQGGAYYSHASGLTASLWASTLELGDNAGDAEIDYTLEYAHGFGEQWFTSIGLTQYWYPGMNSEPDPDSMEALLSAHYGDWLSATIGYSNDVFGEGRTGVSYELSGRFPLAKGIGIAAGLGLYDLSDPYGRKYSFYTLELYKSFEILTVGLAYHDTGGDAVDIFGPTLSGSRSVLYISADF